MTRALLTSSDCPTEFLLDFCVAQEGVSRLSEILHLISKGKAASHSGLRQTVQMQNDIWFLLNHAASRSQEITEIIQKSRSILLFRLLDSPVDLTEEQDANSARLLFTSVALWIVAAEEPENHFLLGRGPERLVEILEKAPKKLQLDLLQPLEKILFRSRRITKYLEIQSADRLLAILRKNWKNEQSHPTLYSIWLLVKNCWNLTQSSSQSDETGFFLEVVDKFVTVQISRYLKENLQTHKNDPILVEEYKKLIFLLYSLSTERSSPTER
jgi:hypothetical protein